MGGDIRERGATENGAGGSATIEVTVGSSTWSTSIFPDTKSQSFVLPVKKAVRVAEGLDDGVSVACGSPSPT